MGPQELFTTSIKYNQYWMEMTTSWKSSIGFVLPLLGANKPLNYNPRFYTVALQNTPFNF
ncbi:Hypothetical protein FKW44_006948, partial [Caligus rogercresseyi]